MNTKERRRVEVFDVNWLKRVPEMSVADKVRKSDIRERCDSWKSLLNSPDQSILK